MLSRERFHLDPQKRVDLEYSSAVTQDLMQRIFRDIPRQEKEKTGKNAPGSHGWRIPKMHAFSFFGYLNRKFGRAKCYDSGCNEKNHKFFVKANAKLTQRISSKFATQLANNDYDRVVIERVFNYIRPLCSQNHSAETATVVESDEHAMAECYYDSDEDELEEEHDNEDEEEWYEENAAPLYFEQNLASSDVPKETVVVKGRYFVDIDIDSRKRFTIRSKWTCRRMNMLGIPPNPFLCKTITDASIKYTTNRDMDPNASISIVGYTSAIIGGVRYRSTPYWKGRGEWCDWACVKFPETTTSTGGHTSICHIMGFFQYTTPGTMTFNNQKVVETDPEDLTDCVDNTLYAVLHCQTTYFKYRYLQGQFIRKFSMMELGDLYILPASCISGPVIVVPDIEDEGAVSLEDYMAILPRHKMGAHFIYHMYQHLEELEGDYVADNREDEKNYGNTWYIIFIFK